MSDCKNKCAVCDVNVKAMCRYTPGYFLHQFPVRRGTFAVSDAEAEDPKPTTSRGVPQQMELFAS